MTALPSISKSPRKKKRKADGSDDADNEEFTANQIPVFSGSTTSERVHEAELMTPHRGSISLSASRYTEPLHPIATAGVTTYDPTLHPAFQPDNFTYPEGLVLK